MFTLPDFDGLAGFLISRFSGALFTGTNVFPSILNGLTFGFGVKATLFTLITVNTGAVLAFGYSLVKLARLAFGITDFGI